MVLCKNCYDLYFLSFSMKITSTAEVIILFLGILLVSFILGDILAYLSIFIYIFNHPTSQIFLIIILMSMTLRKKELDKNYRTISKDGVTRNKSAPRLLPHYCHQLTTGRDVSLLNLLIKQNV